MQFFIVHSVCTVFVGVENNIAFLANFVRVKYFSKIP